MEIQATSPKAIAIHSKSMMLPGVVNESLMANFLHYFQGISNSTISWLEQAIRQVQTQPGKFHLHCLTTARMSSC